jgi:hypothetical protein
MIMIINIISVIILNIFVIIIILIIIKINVVLPYLLDYLVQRLPAYDPISQCISAWSRQELKSILEMSKRVWWWIHDLPLEIMTMIMMIYMSIIMIYRYEQFWYWLRWWWWWKTLYTIISLNPVDSISRPPTIRFTLYFIIMNEWMNDDEL